MTTSPAALFLGLTAIVAALVGVLAFAVRSSSPPPARSAQGRAAEGTETAFMAAAMEEARRAQLRDQERAMKARAEASERLSERDHRQHDVRPAGRRPTTATGAHAEPGRRARCSASGRRIAGRPAITTSLRERGAARAVVIDECLVDRPADLRRAVQIGHSAAGRPPSHLGVTVSPIARRRRRRPAARSACSPISARSSSSKSSCG